MPHSFTDAKGTEWKLRLSLGLEREIHAKTETYLSDVTDRQTLEKLATDRGLMADILWVLCSGQAAEQGVGESEFLDRIDESVFFDAYSAVLEVTLDFLGPQGHAIRQARTEQMRITEEIQRQKLQQMKKMTGAQVAEAMNALAAIGTGSPGSEPEPLESTPPSEQ